MRHYLKYLLPIFSVLLFWSCEDVPIKNTKFAIIEQLLDSLYAAKVFNGAIVIAENDSIIFSKGYGYANFQDSILFTPNTLSDGGSLAKTITAAILWKLHKQGKLSLSDPVQKYLPQFPYPNTALLDIITHNAGGLQDYDYFFQQISDTVSLSNELMLSILSQKRPALSDKEKQGFNYENCGYDLAALIIEKVTGEEYQEYISEQFFRPLGMYDTHVRPALLSHWRSSRTIGYAWQNDSLILNDIADREGFYGGSNLQFSTLDLCKWGTSFYGSNIHQDIIQEGQKPAVLTKKNSGLTQLNWYYSPNKRAYYYWGNIAGFYSHLYYDEENKFTIAFMTNTTMSYHLRQPFAAALVEIMERCDYNRTLFIEPAYVQFDSIPDINGQYETQAGDTIHIFKGERVQHIQKGNGLRYNMFVVPKKIAYVPGIDAWLGFTEEESGLMLHWNSVFHRERALRINSSKRVN